jgi:hypothetical protein
MKSLNKLSLSSKITLSFKIIGFIAGNCVLYYFNSEFTIIINKIISKANKNAKMFVMLLVLFVILFILILNSLQSTQLPAMKPVISYENL